MQVKVFEAPDMTSGLKMVKEALGPDALILSTRTLRKSKLGVLGKTTLEITAAVDSTWPEAKVSQTVGLTSASHHTPSPDQDRQQDITYEQIWSMEEGTGAEKTGIIAGTDQNQGHSNEINELRSIIKSLSERLGRLDALAVSRPYVEPEFRNPAGGDHDCPLTGFLLGRGLNPRVAELVARFSRDAMDIPAEERPQQIARHLTDALARLFSVANPLQRKSGRQSRISLIGPTGVGKTTTIAKLAATYLRQYGGKVGLITIDTYRIAAVEQLKVYGEIMNLPVEVVIKPDQMDQALSRLSDCDLILIDTAGRSPESMLEISEMAAYLRPEMEISNQLLLPATAREAELEMVIDRFSRLPITHVIFTKIDECLRLGVLINIHYVFDKPISYLTNGQRVPEDILAPDPRTIARLIINDHRTGTNG